MIFSPFGPFISSWLSDFLASASASLDLVNANCSLFRLLGFCETSSAEAFTRVADWDLTSTDSKTWSQSLPEEKSLIYENNYYCCRFPRRIVSSWCLRILSMYS